MPRSTGSVRSRIGSSTTVEEIVHSLAKRGCFDLSSSINLGACSEFPCTGRGYCDVYRGALHNGTTIAIKTSRVYGGAEAERDGDRRKILKRAARELYHWANLQHRNVLPLMGLAVFRGQISMISKWMENGNLALFLRLNQDANRSTICADICEGLCYIHANGVVHGDLKEANVMVSPNGIAMIADFGNTQLKDFTLRFSTTAKSGYSIRWAAPELLLEDGGPQVSLEADVYAYGMTILEVLTGKVPYEGTGDNQILILVALEKRVPDRPSVDMPDDLWNLLNSCWNRDQSKRPKIAGVREALQALSWFPSDQASDPQLIKGATPGYTQDKLGGLVEGHQQVRNSETRIGENPAVIGEGSSRINKGLSRSYSPTASDGTGTASERQSHNYAPATPVPPVDQQPTMSMPSPVEELSEPWLNPAATPIALITSQPRGHSETRSKETAPMVKIKSTPSSAPAPVPEPEPESLPPVVPAARPPSRTTSQAPAHSAPQIPIRAPTASGSRPEINRVRNTLGPTLQVPMDEIGFPLQPPVAPSKPPPQPKKFPLTRPASRFTVRNVGKTRAQVEAFHALREQQELERQHQWDVNHTGYAGEGGSAEQIRPSSPQGSVRSRKSRAVTVVSTSDGDDWTTGRLLTGKRPIIMNPNYLSSNSSLPQPGGSCPEINRVRNTLGPTLQVPMAEISSPLQPPVAPSKPPPQPKKFPLTRPASRFTDRNAGKTRAQVEAFHALREQQELERQHQWDVNHTGYAGEGGSAEQSRPPSPQGSVRSRKSRVVTVVSTSNEDDWTTGRSLAGKRPTIMNPNYLSSNSSLPPPRPGGSRPEINRVRNTLGPTLQVPMAPRLPPVTLSKPPPQPKKFPLTRPTSRFNVRNTGKTRAQVEAFHALREQQDLERQRQWDVNHLGGGYGGGGGSAEQSRPPSPQGSVRSRKSRAVTVVSTSDEDDWSLIQR